MAISILSQQTSGSFRPVADPINFTVSSNNSGNCNFKYICRIYVNGTNVFQHKFFPDPVTGYGFFEINKILEDWIANTIPKQPYTTYFNVASATTIPTSLVSVICQFGEEYDLSVNCDGTIYTYLDLATSNTFYAFNGAIDYENWPTWTHTDYLISTSISTTKKFLTNQPRTKEVTNNDSEYLDFISNDTINSNWNIYWTINYKNGGVSQIPTASATTLSGVKRYRIAVGPFDFNKIYGSTVIDWATVDSYSVYLRYTTTQVSETMTYKVKQPKPFQTRLAWINQLGGIDHFTFYHRNKKSYDITRKTFKKSLYSNYANSLTYQVGDRQDTNYFISAQEKHTVATFCRREEAAWLNELYFSPDVWTYNYTDPCTAITTWKMLPINVTTTNVEEKQRTTKPIEYSLEYTTSYDKILLKG